MIALDDIVKQFGGIDEFRKTGFLRLDRCGRTILLEHLENGPTAEHAVRIVRCNHFGVADLEMHLEQRGGVWLPYYFNNRGTDTELFLYRFSGEREVLRVDLWAGARLIEIAGVLDLDLWAEGFVEAAAEALQPSLFPVKGGAA